MMEVKFWRSVFDKRGELLDRLRSGQLSAAAVERDLDGIPPSFTPKPFHGLAIAVFSIVTGLDADWSGSLWSALLGTVAIAVVGLWSGRQFGPGVGLLAAYLMAFSRSHVMYSRSQLAESDAMLILLCGLLAHVSWMQRTAVPGDGWVSIKGLGLGMVYGLAVATNYRCLLMVPLIFVLDFYISGRSGRPGFGLDWRFPLPTLRRVVGVGIGLIAVLAVFELPYRIYIWRGGTLPDGMLTYAEGLVAWYVRGQNLPIQGGNVASLFQPHLKLVSAYACLDGLWWMGGMALGVWAALRQPLPARLCVLSLAFLPLIGFSLVTRGDGPRAVMTSIPFFVILSALGWSEAHRWSTAFGWKPARFAGGFLLVVVLGIAPAFAWPETQVSSAWPAAAEWLKEERRRAPGDKIYTTFPLAVRYYVGKKGVELPPPDAASIPAGLWVVDRYNAVYAYPFQTVQALRSTHSPERIFEGRVYPQTGLFFDWGNLVRATRSGSLTAAVRHWKRELARPDMGFIEIYRVKG